MTMKRSTFRLMITAVLIFAGISETAAQRFAVESFRMLPNDVTAFVNPIRDLNDESCGLIKVMGSEDFVFSTPLGIVKRVDNVGEIWLYVPKGTKKLTIKHAEWGVLRDYVLPEKIDSRVTYELRISEPPGALAAPSAPERTITTVRDTLVVTRVDTLLLPAPRKSIPFEIDAMFTIGYGGRSKSLTGGVMVVAMKRHGAFIHLASDFGRIGPTVGQCDKEGMINSAMPFYSDRSRHSAMLLNAGAAHRLTDHVALFEGIGYSATSVAWQLAPSEGGGFVKNSYYTTKGLSFEVGAILKYNRLRLSASVISIKGRDWHGSVGIGWTFGK